MKIHNWFFIGFLCACVSSVSAQTSLLRQGDTVRSLTLNNLLNYKSKSASLPDFKGKLLILDFWNQYCSSCIASFPKLEKLQKEFNDHIQIILVNPWENEQIVKGILAKRKKATGMELTLPVVCGDSTILRNFGVYSVPHIVWIGKDGVIKSITNGGLLNGKNINSMVKQEPVALQQKIDTNEILNFDPKKPIFLNGNGGEPTILYWQSTFAKGSDKLRARVAIQADKSGGYVNCAKSSVLDLYRLAYSSNKDSFSNIIRTQLSLVELTALDSNKITASINGEFLMKEMYVYQCLAPAGTTKFDMQARMQSDLKFFVGLDVKWEKRKKLCLVFSSTDTVASVYQSGQEEFYNHNYSVKFNNVPLRRIVEYLEEATNYYYSAYPFIDETGIKGNLGRIEFEGDICDFAVFNKALQKRKMKLTLEPREVNCLIISDTEASKKFFNGNSY